MKAGRVVIAILAVVAAMGSCVVVDEVAPKQRTRIEKYLADNKISYVITTDSAYVHLGGNKYGVSEEDRGTGATKGAKVSFNVEAYTFETTPSSKPYYTNKRYLAEQISPELDITYWDFEPYEVTLGKGEILNSLDEALEGSVRGDSLAVFLTSSLAYGKMGMEAVAKDTAVMMVLTVEEVEE